MAIASRLGSLARKGYNEFMKAPVLNTGKAGLITGTTSFGAGQLMNLLDEDRRRASADITSQNIADAAKNLFVSPGVAGEAKELISTLPGRLGQSAMSGVRSGVKDVLADAWGIAKKNPKSVAMGIGTAAVPMLAYLIYRGGGSLLDWYRKRKQAQKTASVANRLVNYGLGTGIGAGAWNVGESIAQANEQVKDLSQAMKGGGHSRLLTQLVDQGHAKLKQDFSPERVGSAAADAAWDYTSKALSSPWTYAGIAATASAPYLLAYLLNKLKAKRTPESKTASVVGKLVDASRYATIPVGAGYGFASMYDPMILPRHASYVAGSAIPQVFDRVTDWNTTAPTKFSELTGDPLVKDIARGLDKTPAHAEEKAHKAIRGAGSRIFRNVAEHPGAAGTAVGAGLTASGLLAYMIWKKLRGEAEDLR